MVGGRVRIASSAFWGFGGGQAQRGWATYTTTYRNIANCSTVIFRWLGGVGGKGGMVESLVLLGFLA